MAIIQKKPTGAADLEHEQTTLRRAIDETRTSQGSLTEELMSLLSAQRGQVAERQPLALANEQAQTALQEARSALARHLGGPNETAFADKLHTAEQAANTAVAALTKFDKQGVSGKERIQELRTTISRQTEQLTTMQGSAVELSEQLEQARELARKAALIKLLSAYSDLYDVMEETGPALSSMRMDAPAEFDRLFADLQIDQQQLWDLLLPSFRSSDLNDSDYWRPFLTQRQEMIKTRLAALNKKK